ncbi:Gamma-tubulin complex component 6 [Homalodisca vitripennis]|nr:Gamma-tubulin complex component 6 [Homalodisca vitripennis]
MGCDATCNLNAKHTKVKSTSQHTCDHWGGGAVKEWRGKGRGGVGIALLLRGAAAHARTRMTRPSPSSCLIPCKTHHSTAHNCLCLLNKRSRTVNSNLVELLGVILTFHEILRSGEWIQDSATSTPQYTHSGFPRLSHQMDNFLRLSRFLYQYLDRLVGSGYQPHLVQLLTLLSANSFYSSV